MHPTFRRAGLVLALLLPFSTFAAHPLRHIILMDGGKEAGETMITELSDHSFKTRFIFKDNGPGPDIEETYTLREDGTFATYRATGTHRVLRAGVTILPGTDALPGFTLHRKRELYVQAGMTPREALQSATWTSATIARVSHDRGRIAEGLAADLVIVEGDPTQDINAIRKRKWAGHSLSL